MNRLLSAVLLVALFSTFPKNTEVLPPLPLRGVEVSESMWVNYSREVVKKLFPTRPRFALKTIVIVKSDELTLKVSHNQIEIPTGLIETLKDENEYAIIIGHELGHELWKQTSVRKSKVHTDKERDLARVQEAEADFVAILVTGDLNAVYQNLQDFAAKHPIENFPRNRTEDELKLAFRLQVMKSMLSRNNFRPIISAEPLPTPLPSWDAGVPIWDSYTRSILRAMYPNYKDVINGLGIDVQDSGHIAEVVPLGDDVFGKIVFNLRLISEVIRNSEEFAVLLGHEFGHVVASRDYGQDYLDTGVAFSDYEWQMRKQLEADLIGTLPLPKGDCIWAETLERIIVSVIKHEPNMMKGDIRFDRSRVKRLREMCNAGEH